MLFRAISLLAVFAIAVPAIPETPAFPHKTVDVSHFSGKPVPRFEHFRFAAVNGREGPSESHPILWRYERAGLPVLIVKESRSWRRVRDPDGDEVWVHARMLSPGRRVLVLDKGAMRSRPAEDAAIVARLAPGVVAEMSGCQRDWCHLSIEGRQGWFARSALWGVSPHDVPL